jgi:MoxR-like ATPase
MLHLHRAHHPISSVSAVESPQTILELREELSSIRLEESVKQYIVDLVTATRESTDLSLGGSPRATLALFKMSRVMAALSGRSYVLPDDVKALAIPVLAHRVLVEPVAQMNGLSAEDVIGSLLEKVPISVPES